MLLLPHGYEGQGPDHSSARLERFLALCAEDNMTVAVPTTPANYFHLLRWQALSRAAQAADRLHARSRCCGCKAAISPVDDFTTRHASGRCSTSRPSSTDAAVRRVLLCSGKVYYDLADRRQRRAAVSDVAIVRVERLYPLPADEIKAELAAYPSAERGGLGPGGAGQHGRLALHGASSCPASSARAGAPGVAARASSAPAGGSAQAHAAEHARAGRRRHCGREGLAACTSPTAGIEELADRRGEDQVTLGWLAERLTEFVDLHPEAEASVDRLASWLARLTTRT